MEAIKVKTHVGEDSILRLELPTGMSNRELEVLVVLQPLKTEAVDELGWPIGFFDRTYGALAGDPIERSLQ
ncbi:MAG: hypothetical protein HZC41_00345 [Chloroflexi bacterium]|nr:hypothetical protein [Chloroflexota bacterium]